MLTRQNSQFWTSATSRTVIVRGVPNGGYLRGRAKTKAAPCDGPPSASVFGWRGPRSSTNRVAWPKSLPCPQRSTLSRVG